MAQRFTINARENKRKYQDNHDIYPFLREHATCNDIPSSHSEKRARTDKPVARFQNASESISKHFQTTSPPKANWYVPKVEIGHLLGGHARGLGGIGSDALAPGMSGISDMFPQRKIYDAQEHTCEVSHPRAVRKQCKDRYTPCQDSSSDLSLQERGAFRSCKRGFEDGITSGGKKPRIKYEQGIEENRVGLLMGPGHDLYRTNRAESSREYDRRCQPERFTTNVSCLEGSAGQFQTEIAIAATCLGGISGASSDSRSVQGAYGAKYRDVPVEHSMDVGVVSPWSCNRDGGDPQSTPSDVGGMRALLNGLHHAREMRRAQASRAS
eukprot:m.414822 g.414822  ORF g.414822 m.414822 type:complete len:325 (+) comp21275_c1_seq2:403-1377(+)